MKRILVALLLLAALSVSVTAQHEIVQNKPMRPGKVYTLCDAPLVTVELDDQGREVYKSGRMRIVGTPTAEAEFSLVVEDAGPLVYKPLRVAASYDSYWVPKGERIPKNLSDLIQKIPGRHKPYTPGTGGAGRGYVSSAGCALAAPITEDLDDAWVWKREAVLALREWVIFEIEQRPLCHVPFKHHGDRYSRKVVNFGQPNEWKHTKADSDGYNAFDTAHLYLCHAYTLAAYGDPLGIVFVHLIGRWCVASAYPGVCTSWTTQPRGIGWVCELGAQLDLLAMWPNQDARDCFSCGLDTETIALRWLQHSEQRIWREKQPWTGDTHNSPTRGHLGFHRAIRAWGLVRMLKSSLNRETRDLARDALTRELEYHDQRIVDERGLMSRVIGTVHYASEADAQAEADRTSLASSKVWLAERFPDSGHALGPAGWYVREAPRTPDTQLQVAPRAVARKDVDAARWWIERGRDKTREEYDLVLEAVIERDE